MALDPGDHHEQCPVCGQQQIGFTDADMLVHILDDHEDDLDETLSLPESETVVCANCGCEYVTYQGECPFCRHGGEPYK